MSQEQCTLACHKFCILNGPRALIGHWGWIIYSMHIFHYFSLFPLLLFFQFFIDCSQFHILFMIRNRELERI